MANIKNGETTIILGGKERKLKYTLYSLSRLEDKGVKLADFGKDLSMKQVMAMLWAGLITHDQRITVDEVGMMVGIEDLPYVTEKLTEAFEGLQGKN